MMGAYSLDELLKQIVKWEKRLDAFYDVMEEYLVDPRSREVAVALQKRQKKTMDVLNAIHVHDYSNTEYIKNIPDYHSEDLIPHFEIEAKSSPRDVFEKILRYEMKLEDYYGHLRGVVVFQKSKDLMDMLLRFKVGQIKEIKNLMDSYDLAV